MPGSSGCRTQPAGQDPGRQSLQPPTPRLTWRGPTAPRSISESISDPRWSAFRSQFWIQDAWEFLTLPWKFTKNLTGIPDFNHFRPRKMKKSWECVSFWLLATLIFRPKSQIFHTESSGNTYFLGSPVRLSLRCKTRTAEDPICTNTDPPSDKCTENASMKILISTSTKTWNSPYGAAGPRANA